MWDDFIDRSYIKNDSISFLGFSLATSCQQQVGGIARSQWMGALFFALASPIGVLIGWALIAQRSSPALLMAIAILQGLACGTFFFVVFCEMLPHEFGESEELDGKVRFGKIASLVLGFAFIATYIAFGPDWRWDTAWTDLMVNRESSWLTKKTLIFICIRDDYICDSKPLLLLTPPTHRSVRSCLSNTDELTYIDLSIGILYYSVIGQGIDFFEMELLWLSRISNRQRLG